ncbi:uncharacterized protein LOC131939517 [Physella acuta]|uniref:uncharacterized protein LOC131939517 n=1 Tax=Physella acuta TaxID=109671 RepID=UPI0027DBBC0A|nr:uncharacterized protein LOC131939517 [Physella acuta]
MGMPDEMDGPVSKRPRLSLRTSRKPGFSGNIAGDNPADVIQIKSEDTPSFFPPKTLGSHSESVSLTPNLPSSADPLVPPVASLYNLGNTCFLNCMLEVLRYTPGFLGGVKHLQQEIVLGEKKEEEKLDEITQTCSADAQLVWAVVKNTHKMYEEMETKEMLYKEMATSDASSMAIKPNPLLDNIRELNPMFEGHFQHDAQELLRCLLCYIEDAEKELNKLKLKETEKITDGAEKDVEDASLISYDDESADKTSAPETPVKANLQQNENTLKGGDPLCCSKGKPVKRARGRPRKALSAIEVTQQHAPHQQRVSTSVSACETSRVGDDGPEPMVCVNSRGSKRKSSNSSLHKVVEKDPQQSSMSMFLKTPVAGGCVDSTRDTSETDISESKKKCVGEKKTGGARFLFRKLQQKLSLGSNSDSSMSGILSMFPLQQIKRLGMRGRVVGDPLKQESTSVSHGTAGHSKSVHGEVLGSDKASDDNNNAPVSKATHYTPGCAFNVGCHGDNLPKYLTSSTITDKSSPRKNSPVASCDDISALNEKDVHRSMSSYDLGTRKTSLSSSPSTMCTDHSPGNCDEISILSDKDSLGTSSSYDLGMRKMHPSRSPSILYPEIPPADANPTNSSSKKEVEITVHSPSKCKSPTRTRLGRNLEGSFEHSHKHQEETPVHGRVTSCGSRSCPLSERNTPAPNSPAHLQHSHSSHKHLNHPNCCEALSPNSPRELEVQLKNCDCLGVSPVRSVSAKHAVSVLNSDDPVPSLKTSTARRAILWGHPESPDASRDKSERKQKPSPTGGKQLNEQTPRVSTRRSPSTSPGSATRVDHMTRRTPSRSPPTPRSPRTPDVSHFTQTVSLRPLSVSLDNCDWLLAARGQTVSASKVLLSMKKNKNSKLQFNYNLKLSTDIFNLNASDLLFLFMGAEGYVHGNTLVEHLFGGTMMHRTKCLECETARERQEVFMDISVPVRSLHPLDVDSDSDEPMEDPRDSCLSKLVEAFSNTERLKDNNKYFCEVCSHYVEAERSCHYTTLPLVLTLHLKRFGANSGSLGGLSKLNDKVTIPQSLPCLRYQCKNCTDQSHRYSLYAIVTHSGMSILHGHYRAYVKVQPQVNRKVFAQLAKTRPNSECGGGEDSAAEEKPPSLYETFKVECRHDLKQGQSKLAASYLKIGVKESPGAGQAKLSSLDVKEELSFMESGEEEGCYWLECDDEYIKVMDEVEFVEKLEERDGALMGTPYILFYHKLVN